MRSGKFGLNMQICISDVLITLNAFVTRKNPTIKIYTSFFVIVARDNSIVK